MAYNKRTAVKRRPSPAVGRTLPESRRREILDEAIRLMEEKGFAAVSVQHVADALAFSKANFYHHLRSKEELLYEVFVDTLRFGITNLGAIISSGRPIPEQLDALVDFYVSLMLDRRGAMLIWFKERAHLSEPHREHVARLETELMRLYEQFYAAGIEQGYFKPVDINLVRTAIFGMCFGLATLPQPTQLTRETIACQLRDLAGGGLLVQARDTQQRADLERSQA